MRSTELNALEKSTWRRRCSGCCSRRSRHSPMAMGLVPPSGLVNASNLEAVRRSAASSGTCPASAALVTSVSRFRTSAFEAAASRRCSKHIPLGPAPTPFGLRRIGEGVFGGGVFVSEGVKCLQGGFAHRGGFQGLEGLPQVSALTALGVSAAAGPGGSDRERPRAAPAAASVGGCLACRPGPRHRALWVAP
ncbi:hypothetical protein CLOM_g23963 [Closterium sp. NIES-68]|nr:hypothetical protein CLOM_g23963 [Closterium sp. NIES-68]